MKIKELSDVARQVLADEETENMRIVNKVRYVFILLIAAPLLLTSIQSGNALGGILNTAGILVILAITIFHTFVIRNHNIEQVRIFNFVTVVADILLILGMIIYWGFTLAPDDFSFWVKTPVWLYMALVLVLTVLQFDTRVVYLAIGIFLVSYISVTILMLMQGVQTTNDWSQYVNGPKVDLGDVLFTKPVIFSVIALIVAHTIRKSLGMVEKITAAESKRALLSRYFSPSVVEDITANSSEGVAARRQKVTILFLDIRGFTKLSEGLDAETLVKWLADFRSRLTSTIFKHNGAVDKYIGDAIMATFGTPRPSETPGEDSTNAVTCALEMFEVLKGLNDDWALDNIDISIGVGIHTGDVFAGSIGDSDQIEYTVIGDPVNTASRIEGLCKKLKRNLIISTEVHKELIGAFKIEKLQKVLVKGKTEPLQLYSIS